MLEFLKSLDKNILLAVNNAHSPFMDHLMWLLSDTWPTVLIVLIAAWFINRRFNMRRAAECVLGCALVVATSDLSTNLVKHQIKRYRPTHNLEIRHHVHTVNDYKGGTYGFYSSHSANTFGVITFIFFFFDWLSWNRKWWWFIYPCLVAYSRMYLGVHYLSDVMTGALAGVLIGMAGEYVINKYFAKKIETAV